MNMMNTMRRGLATTAMSLVCLMAGTMNTLAATADTGTELVSQMDAATREETNDSSAETVQKPSGPASDPELLEKQTSTSVEEAANTNSSDAFDGFSENESNSGASNTAAEAEVAAFSSETAQAEAENASGTVAVENADAAAVSKTSASSDISADAANDTESADTVAAQEAELPAEIYAGRFTTTAYCSCRKCTRGGKNRTKSGTVPQAGRTISADLRVFPLGTKLRINGVVYTVEDSGSGIRGNKLDIFFNSHSQALQYGKRGADVYIVR